MSQKHAKSDENGVPEVVPLKQKRAGYIQSGQASQPRHLQETRADEIYELSFEELLPSEPEDLLSSLLPKDEPGAKKPLLQRKRKKKPPVASPRSQFPPQPVVPTGSSGRAGTASEQPEVAIKVQDTETAKKYLVYDTSVQHVLEAPTMALPVAAGSAPGADLLNDTAVDTRLDPELLQSLREIQQGGGGRFFDEGASTSGQTPASSIDVSGQLPAPPLLAPLPEVKSEPTPLPATPSLRPVQLKQASGQEGAGATVNFRTPAEPALPQADMVQLFPVNERLALVAKVESNLAQLKRFQNQDVFAYLLFDEEGFLELPRIGENPNPNLLFAFPKYGFGRLMSVSVPVGFTQDDRGQLCESHLVLAKSRKDSPIWSLATAELQAAPGKTVQFRKWLSVSDDDLASLNDKQKDQLFLLLDQDHFDRIRNQKGLPPSLEGREEAAEELDVSDALLLTDDDVVDTDPGRRLKHSASEPPSQVSASSSAPKQEPWVPRSQRQEHRLPSKIVHPPANQVSEDSGPRNSELAANLLELFEGVPESSPAPEASAPGGELEPSFVPMPHTLAGPREKQSPPTPATPGFVIPPPSAKTVNRDETAMRRIRMDTAHLDPNALRLHIKIPRRFLGKWFQGTEEVLSIYGHQRETKLGSLGLAIQFSFSQSGQGKVYPQVVVTRSTNIRDIPYAHHSIEIRANRNAEAEQGWDHIQLLERGHVAQVDLSATDQVRGIMYIHVLHPKTGNLLDSIHLSWSVKE